MKVLHFFKTYWPDTFGGVERTIHAIATGSARYGVTSEVLSLSSRPQENSRLFDGHMAHKSQLDIALASTDMSRAVFSRFRELSAEADIVHFHFPWPWMDLVHLATRHGKPTVLTYHSDVVKQKLLLQLYRPLMNRFLGGVDRIVATSPNYIRSSPVLQKFAGKTRAIAIGLDEAAYPPVDAAVRADWAQRLPKRFFLFVGVMRYYKGAHILLEAAKKTGFDVVLVGDGPMLSSLRDQAARYNLANVHFLGALPDADKVALLDLCHAFVFPSPLRSEAFGLSLVEAEIFSKPMISCEIGTGTSYVNIDGETGVVIPPNDPNALASAMTRLWNDPAQTSAFGKAARLRYESLFTADTMARAYVELYTELLADR